MSLAFSTLEEDGQKPDPSDPALDPSINKHLLHSQYFRSWKIKHIGTCAKIQKLSNTVFFITIHLKAAMVGRIRILLIKLQTLLDGTSSDIRNEGIYTVRKGKQNARLINGRATL